MLILRIAVFSPLRKIFDYLAPVSLARDFVFQPGMRIRVPFGSKDRIGILIETRHETEVPLEKLKSALEVLDQPSIFPETIFKLIAWAAQYYHCPIGEVFEAAMPSLLRKGKNLLNDEELQQEYLKKNESVSKTETASKNEITSKNKTKRKNKTELITNTVAKNDSLIIHPNPLKLNAEQIDNAQVLIESLGKFVPYLIDGVTGSGKTEVYIEVIAAAISQNKQALILVPEIGLIPQMLDRLKKRFSVNFSVLHSGKTDKQRLIAWQNAANGHSPIVLGTRSAAFTPLSRPGVFIIDEEHDLSFKQQESFRYSARDLLLMRGNLENCPVILGSATPCLETLYNIEKKGFKKLLLNKRSNNQKPPDLFIMDIRHKKLDQGLSYPLIKKITEHLDKKGQVLLFLNRRGFAPVYMCYDCGHIVKCKHCDAYLTVHHQKNQLKCHHCDFTTKIFKTCQSCSAPNLNPVGVGTERLEGALKTHFPNHSILRIDKDTTRRKGALESAVDRIQNNEAQILLGTQMITKGHHFPNLSLVAILDIDSALFSVDFRSTERLGQLITQVAGRAGRAERLGEVVLQTCHPNHPLLNLLVDKGYATFAEHLLSERKMAKLPPYSYCALLRASAKKESNVFTFLHRLKKSMTLENLQIMGPVAAPMEKKQGNFHAQLLFQSQQRKTLHHYLKHLIEFIESKNLAKNLRWSIDVDPQEI